MKLLISEPNIIRKSEPNFKRKMKPCYLICSGFVLVTILFSFVALCLSSPPSSYSNGNHKNEGGHESAARLSGKLSRRLFSVNKTMTAPQNPNDTETNKR